MSKKKLIVINFKLYVDFILYIFILYIDSSICIIKCIEKCLSKGCQQETASEFSCILIWEFFFVYYSVNCIY